MKEKVAVAKCGSYEKEELKAAVEKVFELSGISRKSFSRILFKPNMLSARLPEEGVTTHPGVVEEAAFFFGGAEKIIGDSPASVKKPAALYWEKCGYKKAADNTGAALVKFNSSFMVSAKDCKGEITEVPVTDYIKQYNVVNIAKLKTHGLTVITSAVKNLYGLIPGFHKSMLHSKFVSPLHFSEFLVSYYREVKKYVAFNIVDAVVSMEGGGPAAGSLKKTGYIIGGSDAVAVDLVCARLLGIKISGIPYLKIYRDLYGLPEIEIVGDEFVPVEKFDVPGQRAAAILSNKALRPYLALLGRWFKVMPVIDDKLCKKCYACFNVCPVNAISRQLIFDRKKCINCLCCFEVCPYKAIEVKKSFMARLFT